MTNGRGRGGGGANPQQSSKFGPRASKPARRGRGRGRKSPDKSPRGGAATPARATTPTSSSPVRAPEPEPTPKAPHVLGNRPEDSYATRLQKSDEMNCQDFLNFLETSMEGSSGMPFYVAEAQILRMKERFKLVVNFNHMRRKNKAMAHYICNNKEKIWEWLMSAVRKFLLAHYGAGDDESLKSNILERADLEFYKMPSRASSLKRGITLGIISRIPWAKNIELSLFSDIGGFMLRSAVIHLIEHHRKGISWDGRWTMADWEIVDGDKVLLTKVYQENSFTPQSGANDFTQVTTTFIDALFGKLKKGARNPLFLMRLKLDLRDEAKKITTADDLLWFRRYIISHPCYMHPLIRAFLVREAFLIFKNFGLFDDPRFAKFKKENEFPYLDWRKLILLSDNHALKEVYWYKVEVRTPENSRYDATFRSMFEYDRNSVEHVFDHSKEKGKQLANDVIEREVYTNHKLEGFLVVLLKELLKECKPGDKFEQILFIYETSGSDWKAMMVEKSICPFCDLPVLGWCFFGSTSDVHVIYVMLGSWLVFAIAA